MRARVLLLQLLAVVAILLATASASARLETQTRVRGIDSTFATCIELEASRRLEHRPANRDAQTANAAGSCVAAEGALARGGPAAEEGFTTLYRTVGEAERASIQGTGRYTVAPGGVEGKYFYPTAEQAANLAKANFPSQGVQTLTSVRVPNSLLGGATRLHVAGEGQVYFFNGQQIQQLGAPNMWLFFPLP